MGILLQERGNGIMGKLHLLEVEINGEGNELAYLSPLDEKGETEGGYRITGPKPWGGSENIARLKISESDIIHYIQQYAPEIGRKLNTELMGALKDAFGMIEEHERDHVSRNGIGSGDENARKYQKIKTIIEKVESSA
jgi:hypothetical protein